MNKIIISIMLLLASSMSYAENKDNKKELSELNNTLKNSPLLPPPPLPIIFKPTPQLSYKYSIDVEKISKGNLPTKLYSSSGNGLSGTGVYYSNMNVINTTVPSVNDCDSNQNNNLVCSKTELKNGWHYSMYSSKGYSKNTYDFSVDISIGELINLKNLETNKEQHNEYKEIKINQNFSFKGKKETYVFKSYSNKNNKDSEEYIFTITMEQNKK